MKRVLGLFTLITSGAAAELSEEAAVCPNYVGTGYFSKSTYFSGLPSATYAHRPSVNGVSTITECELAELHEYCVSEINKFRTGKRSNKNGLEEEPLPEYIHHTGTNKCSSESALGDLIDKGDKTCEEGARNGNRCLRAPADQAGKAAQNSCCGFALDAQAEKAVLAVCGDLKDKDLCASPKCLSEYAKNNCARTCCEKSQPQLGTATTKKEVIFVLDRCLQEMWDEGAGKPGTNKSHWETMRSKEFRYVSCGFAWSTNNRLYMNQDFSTALPDGFMGGSPEAGLNCSCNDKVVEADGTIKNNYYEVGAADGCGGFCAGKRVMQATHQIVAAALLPVVLLGVAWLVHSGAKSKDGKRCSCLEYIPGRVANMGAIGLSVAGLVLLIFAQMSPDWTSGVAVDNFREINETLGWAADRVFTANKTRIRGYRASSGLWTMCSDQSFPCAGSFTPADLYCADTTRAGAGSVVLITTRVCLIINSILVVPFLLMMLTHMAVLSIYTGKLPAATVAHRITIITCTLNFVAMCLWSAFSFDVLVPFAGEGWTEGLGFDLCAVAWLLSLISLLFTGSAERSNIVMTGNVPRKSVELA